MKHFRAQTGGRYTYADDVMNLQDLALAINAIFDGCDNFVVSGCTVSGSSISSGYVYINGEIRKFEGKTGITSWPQYICESNSTENVSYASGTDKIGRTIYGCTVSSSVPTKTDSVTGAVPQYIKFTSSGGVYMKDAFFGKYALLLNSSLSSQTVTGAIAFANGVTVNGLFTGANGASLTSGSNKADFSWNSSDFSIKTTVGTKTYKFVMSNDNGFRFLIDDAAVFSVSSDGIVTNLVLNSSAGLVSGDLALIGTDLFNRGNQTNTGTLNINMIGANGEKSYYRNTIIGNGKGTAILSITGSTGKVAVAGSMTITGSITHSTAVNLGPAIKENGTLLSDKYYTKTLANNTFAKKSELLTDMITTDDQKASVRELLDVYSKDEAEGKLEDSGWTSVVTKVSGVSLYVRQIGKVVCLNGVITGTALNVTTVIGSLPDNITKPSRVIYFIAGKGNMFELSSTGTFVRSSTSWTDEIDKFVNGIYICD